MSTNVYTNGALVLRGMDARCGNVGTVECRVGDAGGESSKFSPEKEHSNITTFQVRFIILT